MYAREREIERERSVLFYDRVVHFLSGFFKILFQLIPWCILLLVAKSSFLQIDNFYDGAKQSRLTRHTSALCTSRKWVISSSRLSRRFVQSSRALPIQIQETRSWCCGVGACGSKRVRGGVCWRVASNTSRLQQVQGVLTPWLMDRYQICSNVEVLECGGFSSLWAPQRQM